MNRFAQYCLIILAASGLIVPDAVALEFQLEQVGDKQILLLRGEFVDGDSLRFSTALRQAGRVDEVWFHSPGGDVIEGMEVGRMIRSARLATRVPSGARCASICAFAFLGGVLRHVDPGGTFIVHMFSRIGNKEFVTMVEKIIKQEGSSGAMKIIAHIEQTSARLARMQADYLLEMSISLRLLFPNYDTAHTDGYTLSRVEMVSYNVVNTQDGY